MPWTTPVDRSTGYTVTATDWNATGQDDLAYLYARPQFQVHLANAQSTTNATTTTINFDTVDKDTNSGWSAVNHNYTIPTGEGGLWLFTFQIQWASNTTGVRGLGFATSGAGAPWTWSGATADPSTTGRMTSSYLVVVAAASTVAGQAYQSSGGALNTSTGIGSVSMSGIRVG